MICSSREQCMQQYKKWKEESWLGRPLNQTAYPEYWYWNKQRVTTEKMNHQPILWEISLIHLDTQEHCARNQLSKAQCYFEINQKPWVWINDLSEHVNFNYQYSDPCGGPMLSTILDKINNQKWLWLLNETHSTDKFMQRCHYYTPDVKGTLCFIHRHTPKLGMHK